MIWKSEEPFHTFNAGIAYAGPGFRTIECSFEFGGIEGDRIEIMTNKSTGVADSDVCTVIVLQAVAVYLPSLQPFFKTVSLDAETLGWVVVPGRQVPPRLVSMPPGHYRNWKAEKEERKGRRHDDY